MATFADRLKGLRKERKETQRKMAELLGITERNYQRYEYGLVDPSASNVSMLAEHFGVSTDYLLGHSDTKKKETVGEWLKSIRVNHGYSLDDIATATGISREMLEAYESDKIIIQAIDLVRVGIIYKDEDAKMLFKLSNDEALERMKKPPKD